MGKMKEELFSQMTGFLQIRKPTRPGMIYFLACRAVSPPGPE
jgi:hypothetical protein